MRDLLFIMSTMSLIAMGPLKLCCLETGEVNTVSGWAEAIAKRRGASKKAVYNYLYRIVETGTGKAYGLTWEICG